MIISATVAVMAQPSGFHYSQDKLGRVSQDRALTPIPDTNPPTANKVNLPAVLSAGQSCRHGDDA